MVERVTHKSLGMTDEVLSYTYDNNGNITQIRKNNVLIARYTYDGMNQLIREDNALLGKSYAITYDTAGNILAKNTFPYTLGVLCCPIDTDEYTYPAAGWKDKLISYNGQNIIYDEIGNPTTYLGHNLTWDKVRQLASFGDTTFSYDAGGKRCRKNDIEYVYDGDKLLKETRSDCTITYLYDTTGVCGFIKRRYFVYDENTTAYNYEEPFYYVKNLQGDVTAIYSECGCLAAEYTYDAWGNCTITYDPYGIGELNPIRYRSYYYDTETGLYYLKSRYYDPNTGRFINADSELCSNNNILGYNMFAYCGNNPINRFDPIGKSWVSLTMLIIIASSLFGCTSKSSYSFTTPKTLDYESKSTPCDPVSCRSPLTDDQKVLIATIAAEATVTANGTFVSPQARQAMANVALNRVGKREWSKYTTVAEICKYSGFDGYGSKNYWKCMEYLNNRDGSNSVYETIIGDVLNAYNFDITNGCQLYYTPAAMKPTGRVPNWNFNLLTEIPISGVDPFFEGRFYKYN